MASTTVALIGAGDVAKYTSLSPSYLALADATPDTQILQFVLLVTVFSLFHSAAGSTWHLLGLAMQLAIALDLHRDNDARNRAQPSGSRLATNLFWTAYILDR